MIDPVTGLATVTAVVNTMKSIMGLAKDVNNGELNQKIIELQGLIFELQGKLINLQTDNADMSGVIANLESQLAIKGSIVSKHDVYWLPKDERHDGPFCQYCCDDGRKLIRLRRLSHEVSPDHYTGGFVHKYYCDIHRIEYYLPCTEGGELSIS